MGVIWWGTGGTCPPHFFTPGGQTMFCLSPPSHFLTLTGADPEILVTGRVKVEGFTDQKNFFFKLIYSIDLITFRYSKPGYLTFSYSGVSKMWSAIFVRCTVPEIYFCF